MHAFMMAYNARRLKTLKGLTPYEYVCKIWTKEPARFNVNPFLHTVGLNSSRISATNLRTSILRSEKGFVCPCGTDVRAGSYDFPIDMARFLSCFYGSSSWNRSGDMTLSVNGVETAHIILCWFSIIWANSRLWTRKLKNSVREETMIVFSV